VVVAVPPLNEPVPPNVLALLATNPLDVLPASGPELHVGAVVKRLDDTGQTVEFLLAPGPALTDAEVTVRLNSSDTRPRSQLSALMPLSSRSVCVACGKAYISCAGIETFSSCAVEVAAREPVSETHP
jgi:hypothetical protein